MIRILLFCVFGAILMLAALTAVMGGEFAYGLYARMLQIEVEGLSAFSAPIVDGSVRFYAVIEAMFAGFGLWVAWKYSKYTHYVTPMMVALILGGLLRLWSLFSTTDASLFSYVLSLSEILPAVLILVLYYFRRRPRLF